MANHRSKSVVERNLPRWFRKSGFRAWDDFMAFFKQGGAGSDATLQADYQELEAKGDDAQPKALGRLIKAYNKGRRFSKTEVAPPWYFVEGAPGKELPADDQWTLELSNDLDHDRSQRPAPPRPERRKAPGGPEGGAGGAPAAGDAPREAAEAAPEPPTVGVVPPPASDKTWGDALRRLPGAIQLLVDGRGTNTSELNDRRRRALDLAQIDRAHNLARHGAELRKQLLEWILDKKRSSEEIEAEIKRHTDQIDSWIKAHVELARAKAASFDSHVQDELKTRLKKLYPKAPDADALVRLAKQAVDATRPKRLGAWAKKVIDDFNNSRGSAAEKIRDPRILDGLVRWLTQKREQDTPTDGEIYEQIQHLGGPNMAARKKRQEGPRPPKQQERKSQKELEAEAEEKAVIAETRAAERARRSGKPAPSAGAAPPAPSGAAPPPPPPPPPAPEPAPHPEAEAEAS